MRVVFRTLAIEGLFDFRSERRIRFQLEIVQVLKSISAVGRTVDSVSGKVIELNRFDCNPKDFIAGLA
jgi:hypothetical protein